MSVKEILANKGNDVIAVTEDAKLRDAILILNAKNIGVVLVTDEDGQLKGILSERDIIRRALSQETGFRDEPVSKTMTNKVECVNPDASVDDVMDIMTRKRIRHIPVLDDGQLAGLISIGDVVKKKIADHEQEAAHLRDYIATG